MMADRDENPESRVEEAQMSKGEGSATTQQGESDDKMESLFPDSEQTPMELDLADLVDEESSQDTHSYNIEESQLRDVSCETPTAELVKQGEDLCSFDILKPSTAVINQEAKVTEAEDPEKDQRSVDGQPSRYEAGPTSGSENVGHLDTDIRPASGLLDGEPEIHSANTEEPVLGSLTSELLAGNDDELPASNLGLASNPMDTNLPTLATVHTDDKTSDDTEVKGTKGTEENIECIDILSSDEEDSPKKSTKVKSTQKSKTSKVTQSSTSNPVNKLQVEATCSLADGSERLAVQEVQSGEHAVSVFFIKPKTDPPASSSNSGGSVQAAPNDSFSRGLGNQDHENQGEGEAGLDFSRNSSAEKTKDQSKTNETQKQTGPSLSSDDDIIIDDVIKTPVPKKALMVQQPSTSTQFPGSKAAQQVSLLNSKNKPAQSSQGPHNIMKTGTTKTFTSIKQPGNKKKPGRKKDPWVKSDYVKRKEKLQKSLRERRPNLRGGADESISIVQDDNDDRASLALDVESYPDEAMQSIVESIRKTSMSSISATQSLQDAADEEDIVMVPTSANDGEEEGMEYDSDESQESEGPGKTKHFLSQCPVCLQKVTKPSFIRHKVIHLPFKLFDCRFCKYETSDSSGYVKHLRTKHNRTLDRRVDCICRKCGKNCRRIMKLLRHAATHLKDKDGNVVQEKSKPKEGEIESGQQIEESVGKGKEHANTGKTISATSLSHEDEGSSKKPERQQGRNGKGRFVKGNGKGKVVKEKASPTLSFVSNIPTSTSDDDVVLEDEDHEDLPTCSKMFDCIQCDISCTDTSFYIEHVKSQHKDDPKFQCPICTRVFKETKNFILHIRIQNCKEGNSLLCNLCSFTAADSTDFAEHEMNTHFICHVCRREFKILSSLQPHLLTHLLFNPFKCYACKFQVGFSDIQMFSLHWKLMHKGEAIVYSCWKCENTFSGGAELSRHVFKHVTLDDFVKIPKGRKDAVPAAQTVYTCHKCPYKCVNKQFWDYHTVSCHGENNQTVQSIPKDNMPSIPKDNMPSIPKDNVQVSRKNTVDAPTTLLINTCAKCSFTCVNEQVWKFHQSFCKAPGDSSKTPKSPGKPAVEIIGLSPLTGSSSSATQSAKVTGSLVTISNSPATTTSISAGIRYPVVMPSQSAAGVTGITLKSPPRTKIFRCTKCHFISSNTEEHVQHVISKHNAKNIQYQCHMCKALFTSPASLVAHVDTHSKVVAFTATSVPSTSATVKTSTSSAVSSVSAVPSTSGRVLRSQVARTTSTSNVSTSSSVQSVVITATSASSIIQRIAQQKQAQSFSIGSSKSSVPQIVAVANPLQMQPVSTTEKIDYSRMPPLGTIVAPASSKLVVKQSLPFQQPSTSTNVIQSVTSPVSSSLSTSQSTSGNKAQMLFIQPSQGKATDKTYTVVVPGPITIPSSTDSTGTTAQRTLTFPPILAPMGANIRLRVMSSGKALVSTAVTQSSTVAGMVSPTASLVAPRASIIAPPTASIIAPPTASIVAPTASIIASTASIVAPTTSNVAPTASIFSNAIRAPVLSNQPRQYSVNTGGAVTTAPSTQSVPSTTDAPPETTTAPSPDPSSDSGSEEEDRRFVVIKQEPMSDDESAKTSSAYKCDQCQTEFVMASALLNHQALVHGRWAKVPGEDRQNNSETESANESEDGELSFHYTVSDEDESDDDSDNARGVASKPPLSPGRTSALRKLSAIPSWKCYYNGCRKHFLNAAGLFRHVLIHLVIKIFKCNLCGISYSDASTYYKHSTRKHNLNNVTYNCLHCGHDTAMSTRDLLSHMESHPEFCKETFFHHCPHCSCFATSITDIQTHVKSSHDMKRKFHCYFCSKDFKESILLHEHLCDIHLPKVMVMCNLCDYKTNDARAYQTHMELLHDGTKYRHRCPICQQVVKLDVIQVHLLQHSLSHVGGGSLSVQKAVSMNTIGLQVPEVYVPQVITNPDDDALQSEQATVSSVVPIPPPWLPTDNAPVEESHQDRHNRKKKKKKRKHSHQEVDHEQWEDKCCYCGAQFALKSILKQHMWSHINFTPYNCYVCSFRTSNLASYDSHMTRFHRFEVVQYVCPLCKSRRNKSKHLIAHYELMHSVSLYKCSKCDVSFESMNKLNKHFKSSSCGITIPQAVSTSPQSTTKAWKGEVCRFCCKTFPTSSTLSRHEKTHTKPFVCSLRWCLYRGGEKANLVHHENKLQHNGLWCQYCPTKFHSKKELTFHEYSHQDKDNYSCASCTRTFIHFEHLKIHTDIYLENYPDMKCQICNEKLTLPCQMLVHEENHSRKLVSIFCPFCNLRCSNINTYNQHQKEAHGVINLAHGEDTVKMLEEADKSKRTCPFCFKTCNSPIATNSHLKMKHAIDSYLAGCVTKTMWKNTANLQLTDVATDDLIAEDEEDNEEDDDDSLKCKFCGAKFTHRGLLRNHEAAHSKTIGQPFPALPSRDIHECKYCGFTFVTAAELKAHEHLHKDMVASQDADNQSDGEKNKQMEENRTKEDEVIEIDNNDEDEETDNGERDKASYSKVSYDCPFCDVKYSCKQNVMKHIMSHAGQNVNHGGKLNVKVQMSFKCDQCSASFKYQHKLKKHKKTHSAEEGLIYKCKFCAKEFSHLSIYHQHNRTMHAQMAVTSKRPVGRPRKYPLTASEPNREGSPGSGVPPEGAVDGESDGNQLVEGTSVHTQGVQPTQTQVFYRYICKFCSKRFRKKKQWNMHVYKCGKSHSNSVSMDRVNEARVGQPQQSVLPYKHSCKFCNKKFRKLKTLNAHITQCQLSGTSANVSNVGSANISQTSLDLASTNQKPRPSGILGIPSTSSTAKGWLYPHKCKQCDSLFRKKKALDRHMVQLHGVKKTHAKSQVVSGLTQPNQGPSSSASTKKLGASNKAAKKFGCATCGERFFREVSLLRHLPLHRVRLETQIKRKPPGTGSQGSQPSNLSTNQKQPIIESGSVGQEELEIKPSHVSVPFPSKEQMGVAGISSNNKSTNLTQEKKDLSSNSKTTSGVQTGNPVTVTLATTAERPVWIYPYNCKYCGAPFLKRTIYDKHLKKHRNQIKRELQEKSSGDVKISGTSHAAALIPISSGDVKTVGTSDDAKLVTKRMRGRPRKYPVGVTGKEKRLLTTPTDVTKRKRGRPKKHPDDVTDEVKCLLKTAADVAGIGTSHEGLEFTKRFRDRPKVDYSEDLSSPEEVEMDVNSTQSVQPSHVKRSHKKPRRSQSDDSYSLSPTKSLPGSETSFENKEEYRVGMVLKSLEDGESGEMQPAFIKQECPEAFGVHGFENNGRQVEMGKPSTIANPIDCETPYGGSVTEVTSEPKMDIPVISSVYSLKDETCGISTQGASNVHGLEVDEGQHFETESKEENVQSNRTNPTERKTPEASHVHQLQEEDDEQEHYLDVLHKEEEETPAKRRKLSEENISLASGGVTKEEHDIQKQEGEDTMPAENPVQSDLHPSQDSDASGSEHISSAANFVKNEPRNIEHDACMESTDLGKYESSEERERKIIRDEVDNVLADNCAVERKEEDNALFLTAEEEEKLLTDEKELLTIGEKEDWLMEDEEQTLQPKNEDVKLIEAEGENVADVNSKAVAVVTEKDDADVSDEHIDPAINDHEEGQTKNNTDVTSSGESAKMVSQELDDSGTGAQDDQDSENKIQAESDKVMQEINETSPQVENIGGSDHPRGLNTQEDKGKNADDKSKSECDNFDEMDEETHSMSKSTGEHLLSSPKPLQKQCDDLVETYDLAGPGCESSQKVGGEEDGEPKFAQEEDVEQEGTQEEDVEEEHGEDEKEKDKNKSLCKEFEVTKDNQKLEESKALEIAATPTSYKDAVDTNQFVCDVKQGSDDGDKEQGDEVKEQVDEDVSMEIEESEEQGKDCHTDIGVEDDQVMSKDPEEPVEEDQAGTSVESLGDDRNKVDGKTDAPVEDEDEPDEVDDDDNDGSISIPDEMECDDLEDMMNLSSDINLSSDL